MKDKKITAAITGVGAWVPEYILDNDELSRMVDTTDEWIMTRIGVKERHILKGEGMGSSYMGERAVRDLLEKTGTDPMDIDLLICATVTPDMFFPATANLICAKVGAMNAFGYDLIAACSGFLFALSTASQFIETGKYKKVVVVGADKMSSITDYTDRATCPIFGDGSGAVLLEPSEDGYGIIDFDLHSDGNGAKHLHMKAGGSAYPPTHETIDNKWHYIYQEGQPVFKAAVSHMADVALEVMNRKRILPISFHIRRISASLRPRPSAWDCPRTRQWSTSRITATRPRRHSHSHCATTRAGSRRETT